jgi:hypothetical protein
MPDFLYKRDRRSRTPRRLARFLTDDRGNFAALAAILIPLLLIAVGAATDYTSAARRQETLQGVSDAAVLASTQPAMMAQSCYPNSGSPQNAAACALVQQQVVNVFNAQGAGVTGVTFTPITTSAIYIADSGNQRVATLTWTEKSNNLFAGVLGLPSIAIAGQSVAKNGSPVTLFYMLIDNTPSMAFPATADGVSDMLNASPANYTAGVHNGGCSLSCHESDPNAGVGDALWNPSNITCPATDAAYSSWSGTTQFPCVQGQSYTISSGTYVAATGLVTLTLASNSGVNSGNGFYVTSATGVATTPGDITTLDSTTTGGAFTAVSPSTGTTVTYTIATGLSITSITGGTVTSQMAATNTGQPGPLVGGATGAPTGSGTGSTIGCATSIGGSPPPQPQYTGTFYTGATTAGSKFTGFWGNEDAFALSRCLGVQLRIDLVNQALSSLLTTAPAMATTNNTTYAVDIFSVDLGDNNSPSPYNGTNVTQPTTVDVGLEPVYFWGCTATYQVNAGCTQEAGTSIVTQTTSQMTTNFGYATAASNTLAPLETYQAGQTTSGGCGDPDSPLDLALQYLYAGTGAVTGACGATGTPAITAMATPGTGLPVAGNSPAEVLFIVSDGMNDVDANGGSYPAAAGSGQLSKSCIGASKLYTYYGRPLYCMGQTTDGSGNTYCADIKAKGIEIAFLYLRYNTLNTNLGASQPSEGYYYDIEPWQYPGNPTDYNNADFPGTYTDDVEQGAIACASTGLEFTINEGDNITTAMATLFQKAAQSVYLAH